MICDVGRREKLRKVQTEVKRRPDPLSSSSQYTYEFEKQVSRNS